MDYSLYFSWAGLGRIIQAEEYLSQAQWTVLKSTECCYATHSLLHRNLGLLYMAKENYEEARYHLAYERVKQRGEWHVLWSTYCHLLDT